MKYQTTKIQCQKQIDKWQNVCTRCGEQLTPFKTVDNSGQPTYWVGCNSCQVFNNGTKPHIYKIAVRMVDERHFTPYSYDQQPDKEKEPELFDYWRKGQIGGAVGVVADVLRFNTEAKQEK